jgi:cell division transport system permease protein
VQVDRDWARRADATAELIRQLLRVTALLLGLAVIAVVANTIRLEIHSQRTAIETAQLVGASRAFVRRPFLYLGALYAVAAALLACGVVALAGRALADPVSALASAYGTGMALRWPGPRDLGILFGAAFLLGWLGAAVAAAQQVSDLDADA